MKRSGNIFHLGYFAKSSTPNVFEVDIYILKQIKQINTRFGFISEEMEAVIKSYLGLGVHLESIKYVKPRLNGKTSTLNLQ